MTDTLKPAELDLEALKKVALEAREGPWTTEADACGDWRIFDACGEQIDTDEYMTEETARFLVAANPAAVLSLLTRIEALEAERDYAWSEMKNAQAYWRAETAHAEAAEAQRDRMREAAIEACDLLAERIYGSPARSPGHNARVILESALSQGTA